MRFDSVVIRLPFIVEGATAAVIVTEKPQLKLWKMRRRREAMERVPETVVVGEYWKVECEFIGLGKVYMLPMQL